MLLVKPVTAGFRALPALVVPLILGAQTGNPAFLLIAIVGLVYVATIDWLTTRYRVGPEHVQLKRGLLQRNVLSVPRSRVRSVDTHATVLHRILGLTVLRIGTGTDDSGFELDAIAAEAVPELRAVLLVSGPPAASDDPEPETGPGSEIADWQASWMRYAPLGYTGLVAIGAGLGLFFQSGAAIDRIADSGLAQDAASLGRELGPLVASAMAVLLVLVAASAIAIARYILSYSGFTLHDDGHVLRVEHGLLTTRESTLDRRRLRGVSIEEPVLLRLGGGARARAIMTGIGESSGTSALVLPDAPRQRAQQVAAAVVGDPGVMHVALRGHGSAAFRRRMFRAVAPPAIVLAALAIAVLAGASVPWWAWLAAGLLLAASTGLGVDRYRSLGHATPAGWLVCQSGSLLRSRDMVDAEGIVGWSVRQTFFQRRSGLATLTAATPAGADAYQVIDVPEPWAWDIIAAVTPRMIQSLPRATR
ncbi:PH domain-containing protein [Hoyosella sp. G463]|uniref:PH domain-containing protein n=2 Tax=Lolliginicoccus lacisalsi TaxID=2742202 RepID=A0A927PKQ1_9ACTN|nr:PH domain-containing protein [Lolliginicoccus lacisalsi]MBD8506270.1 PH domain-containing protein [Lolliginicoccus lacisalsi]